MARRKSIEIKDRPYEYELEISIGQICATQNTEFDKRVERKKLGFKKSQTTTFEEAAVEPEPEEGKEPEDEEKVKVPTVSRKRKKKRTDVENLLCHCFQRNNGHLVQALGGPWGDIKRALNKAAEAMNISKYKAPSLDLIKFVPAFVDLGPDKDVTLTPVLEPRSRKTTREKVLYETITDRKVEMRMLVSKTCPLTGPEIAALLTGLMDFDGFGPSRRGFITDIKVN